MENLAENQSKEREEIKEKKTRRIHIVVTESEYKQFVKYSAEYKNISDYIRDSCLVKNKKPFQKTKELTNLLKQLTTEMNNIGKNINQVARYTNFLQENKIISEGINRFNTEIVKYTSLQMKFEKLLKNLFK